MGFGISGLLWDFTVVRKPFASQLSGCHLVQEMLMPPPVVWLVEPSASELGDLGHVPASSLPVPCAGREEGQGHVSCGQSSWGHTGHQLLVPLYRLICFLVLPGPAL